MALRLFVYINGWSWSPMPTVDAGEAAMLAIAAGEMSEVEVAVWLREHLSPPGPDA